ncbi:hypothetical protein [Motilibacter rhizosphaerae]|nr:hypothetical protein [Motilibacter rhizosphaerae]
MRWSEDDDELVAQLRAVVSTPEPVPDDVVTAAKGVFTWRTIDAELAALTYDSVVDEALAGVRSETAQVRTLTFEGGSLVIELSVVDGGLTGQVYPARQGSVTVRRLDEEPVEVALDELGCFRVEPRPTGLFSLQVLAADGVDVVTDWVSI